MPVLNFIRNHLQFTFIMIVGIISLIFGLLIFGNSGWGDWYYSTVFVPVNERLQAIFEYSDVPFYIVVGIILFTIVIGQILTTSGKSWRDILISWLLFLSSSAILLTAFFYWMWGFNYGRTTIEVSYFNQDFVTLDTNAFKRRWELQTNRVNHLRDEFVMPDDKSSRFTQNFAQRFRQTAAGLDFFFDLNMNLRPQCKDFEPAGLLLRLNTAGFYFPYGSESYVDKALHVSQKPFVIAHEMSHGYGVTDEGEANFVGYILCQSSGDPLARYSSALSLWLYMASDGRHLDKEFIQEMWDNLSPKVWADLNARRALDEQYQEIMPRMRDAIYDSYLSLNKVKDGLKSYNRFVRMVLTYEEGRK